MFKWSQQEKYVALPCDFDHPTKIRVYTYKPSDLESNPQWFLLMKRSKNISFPKYFFT